MLNGASPEKMRAESFCWSVSILMSEQKMFSVCREENAGTSSLRRFWRPFCSSASASAFLLAPTTIFSSVVYSSEPSKNAPSFFYLRSHLKIKQMCSAFLKKRENKSVSLAVQCSAVFSAELLNLPVSQQLLSRKLRSSLSEQYSLKTSACSHDGSNWMKPKSKLWCSMKTKWMWKVTQTRVQL